MKHKLSRRTNLYLQADASRVISGYAANAFDTYAFPVLKDAAGRVTQFVGSRVSATAGMRHQF